MRVGNNEGNRESGVGVNRYQFHVLSLTFVQNVVGFSPLSVSF